MCTVLCEVCVCTPRPVQTCVALFSLFAQDAGQKGRFCKKPSRNKVTNRIELKDVSYDS